MFENEIQKILIEFDGITSYNFINLKELIENINIKDETLYHELKMFYKKFQDYEMENEIYAGSQCLYSLQSDILDLYKKYNKNYGNLINIVLSFICFYQENYDKAIKLLNKDKNLLELFSIYVSKYESNNLPEDKKEAFIIAQNELKYECTNGDMIHINLPVFKFILEYSIEINDFSFISSLIDIVISIDFNNKNTSKLKDFYYCLIKLAHEKSINLNFLENKSFFSKENFQRICNQIKKHLNVNTTNGNLSYRNMIKSCGMGIDREKKFEELIQKAEKVQKNNDFPKAEDYYREAMKITTNPTNLKQTFKKLISIYENIDYIKTLSLINEFFDKKVFDNDFQKYYLKSKMLILTHSNHSEIVGNLELLSKNDTLNTFQINLGNANQGIILIMELIKTYTENLLENSLYDKALFMCKMGLDLNNKVQCSDANTDSFKDFFNKKKSSCNHFLMNINRKGIAMTIEDDTSINTMKTNDNDPNNIPIFKFNPNAVVSLNEFSNFEDYEHYYIDCYIKTINRQSVTIEINNLINTIEIFNYIKSIYIVNNTFIGTPEQARKDIDFYLNSNIRTSFNKKYYQYLSIAKIVSNVIDKYGELEELNLTNNSKKMYIMYAMYYFSKCAISNEIEKYYLNIARLINIELIKDGYSMEILEEINIF